MMRDFLLSEIATVVDCEHRTAPAAPQGDAYGYSIGTRDIKGGRIDFTVAKRVSRQTWADWSRRAVVGAGDLILAREAPVGQVGFVSGALPVCLGQRTVLVRPNEAHVDARYLHFRLLAPDAQGWMEARAEGSTVVHLNVSDVRQLPIPGLPPLDQQRRIAAVLGGLDDLIDTNRGITRALGDAATAAFRRAMRRAGSARRSVADLCRIVGGSTPSTAEPAFWEGGTVAWATPRDLSRLPSVPLLYTERRITEEGLGQISSGLLPSGTLLMSSRAPVGYLAIAEVPVAVNQGFIAMICDQGVPSVFLWQWLAANLEHVLSRANGSTFQEISKANFRSIPVDVPDAATLDAYERAVQPLYQSIVELERESAALRAARDGLLPLLMSGRVRPEEAL